ncbi:MAG: hypothetical protein WA151_06250, partial [Desulfatirhabdiaceae bacterium]
SVAIVPKANRILCLLHHVTSPRNEPPEVGVNDMCSQSKGNGSAKVSPSICGKIRTIPALFHCASHRQDNGWADRCAVLFPRILDQPDVGEKYHFNSVATPEHLFANDHFHLT